MANKNHWIDNKLRDHGTYRCAVSFDDDGLPRCTKQYCNQNDAENAMISALDAGLTAEEIADIQLGSGA